jgi:hypothetical protein
VPASLTDSISGAEEVAVGNGAVKRSDDAGRANNATVVVVSIIVAILLVLLGLISCDELVAGLRGDPPAVESPPGTTSTPSAAPEAGCRDDLAGFRTFAGTQPGPRGAVLASITLVCWEPSGALRVESKLAPDIGLNSESITWLCQTLSGHISQSGLPWQGFTVYSKHPAFDGQPMLAGRTPGGACTKSQL